MKSNKKKEEMIEKIVDSWTDSMGLDDLINFYRDHQINYLKNETLFEIKSIYKETFETQKVVK